MVRVHLLPLDTYRSFMYNTCMENCAYKECLNKKDKYSPDGYCQKHYGNKRCGWQPCKLFDECSELAEQKSTLLCHRHASRARIHGDASTKLTNNGSGRFVSRGYVSIKVPVDHPFICMARSIGGSRYIMEHRLVMAEFLGRPLLPYPAETVHHIDGDTENNSIDNLQLRFGSHGQGISQVCGSCGSQDIRTVEL